MKHIVIRQAAQYLRVPESCIGDIISILKGAGVMEDTLVNGHAACRWIAPGADTPQEYFLDTRIEFVGRKRQEASRYCEPYITAQQLASIMEDNSRMLAIAAPYGSFETHQNASLLVLHKSKESPVPPICLLESSDRSIRPISFMTHADSLKDSVSQSVKKRRREESSSKPPKKSKRHAATSGKRERGHGLATLAQDFTSAVCVSTNLFTATI